MNRMRKKVYFKQQLHAVSSISLKYYFINNLLAFLHHLNVTTVKALLHLLSHLCHCCCWLRALSPYKIKVSPLYTMLNENINRLLIIYYEATCANRIFLNSLIKIKADFDF